MSVAKVPIESVRSKSVSGQHCNKMSLWHYVKPIVTWIKKAQDRASVYVSAIKFLLNLYEVSKICIGVLL